MIRWPGGLIATIDMLVTLVVIFLVLAASPSPPQVSASDRPICQMAIDIEWQGNLPTDVDLWVMGPDNRPVGYSAKAGHVFDLVRDDLGTVTDSNEINSERACARNLPDGEYVVNVHLYNTATPPPIPVHMEVSMVDPSAATMEVVEEVDTILTSPGQQTTMLRFNLKDQKVVTGSEYDLPINLREKSKENLPRITR